MDTVTATGRVRRTVRVAVALVVGHALLGALIGWLTFGYAPASGPRSAAPAVDGLGASPPSYASPGRHQARDFTVRRFEPATRRPEPRVRRAVPDRGLAVAAPAPTPVKPSAKPSASPTAAPSALPAVPPPPPRLSPSPTPTVTSAPAATLAETPPPTATPAVP